MTRTFIRSAAVAAALLLAPSISSAQVEDFNAPSNAWESGWLGLNSDLMNYYCSGTRGCTNRGNAPTALWAWGNPLIVVNFNPLFGAAINYFSVDVGAFVNTNFSVYDMSNNLISSQAVAVSGVYSDGPTYSVTSSNGVSRFEFDASNGSGNINIDNVTVNAVVATPEPASVVLLATGLIGVIGVARRHRRS